MLNRHLRPQAPAETPGSVAPVYPGAAQAPAVMAESNLDPGALKRLEELDPSGHNQLLVRVLHAFQASVARLRPQLDAARGTGDRATIRLIAHTLKSSSASIGAVHLSQLCAEIETTIRLAAALDPVPDLEALGVALDQTLRAIQRLLKERA